MSSIGAYNLGATRGIGSSTRMYNLCRQTNSAPWTCINQFINPPTPVPIPLPKPGKMKTVFLLELTAGITENDNAMKNTINYYWNTYPQEFIKCPIVDTQGSLDITLQLLNEYYNYGFRYFVGFSRSSIVNGVLDWFNKHPEATGVSSTSTAPILDIPKNIFRMTANDHYMVDSVKSFLENKTVNYIYNDGELACTNLIPYIHDIIGSGGTLNLYPITNSNFSSLISLNSSPSTDIMLVYVFIDRQDYLNLFSGDNPILFYTNTQYDISGIGTPNITGQSKLVNNYNTSLFKGIQTSILWRNGYYTLGSINYSIVMPNILILLNYFLTNTSIDNINSHFGILQFDPVTKDLLYPTFLIEKFIGNNKYTNLSLSLQDPLLGPYNAIFTNPPPVITNIQTLSYKPYGKAIALFDLTKYTSNMDTIFRDSLYYYWYKDNTLPRFPIIDTETNIEKTLDLIKLYYSQGYRIFLGMSRSSVIGYVTSWFDAHPDAVGISIWSTAPSLKIKKNIYRLTPSEDNTLSSVLPKISGKIVYFLYTDDELASFSLLEILQNTPSITLKSLGIKKNYSNLTVTIIQDFFNGATPDDVTLLYLFNDQPYFDLFIGPDGLTFPGLQYDIINGQIPIISGEGQTILKDKLYFIQNTYPNTSLLWRENAKYLTDKFEQFTESKGIINALKMIDYFLKGKNIGLLASYLAVLEFDTITKDIKYPSYLFRLYNGNTFVKKLLYFDDPLYGSFYADFV